MHDLVSPRCDDALALKLTYHEKNVLLSNFGVHIKSQCQAKPSKASKASQAKQSKAKQSQAKQSKQSKPSKASKAKQSQAKLIQFILVSTCVLLCFCVFWFFQLLCASTCILVCCFGVSWFFQLLCASTCILCVL